MLTYSSLLKQCGASPYLGSQSTLQCAFYSDTAANVQARQGTRHARCCHREQLEIQCPKSLQRMEQQPAIRSSKNRDNYYVFTRPKNSQTVPVSKFRSNTKVAFKHKMMSYYKEQWMRVFTFKKNCVCVCECVCHG